MPVPNAAPTPIRVVQWATGTVGRMAVEAVVGLEGLELVGALVYSADKAGRDVGEISGIGPVGVTATTDVDEIVALDADCVVYAAQGEMDPMGAVDDICRLLESGKNVVSTAVTGLIFPSSLGADVADRMTASCVAGGTSFHATGIEPGWAAEVLPLTLSGLSRRIDSVLVQELMDYSTYASRDMLVDIMGFGQLPDVDVPMGDPDLVGGTFRGPIMLLGAGLGVEIEEFRYMRKVATAAAAFEVAAGRIEAGTVSAQRFGYSGLVDGRPVITIEHITRLGPDQAPDWPRGRGWRVEIEGTPSTTMKVDIAVHGEDETEQGCLGTAMHAVHAIAPVCAAAPGIVTFLDLPMIIGTGVVGSDIVPAG
jgi:2,4-diaminopentanoate dehydrogenase